MLALAGTFALDPYLYAWIRIDCESVCRDIASIVSLLGTGAVLLPIVAIFTLRGWLLDRRDILLLGLTALVALVLVAVASPMLKLAFSRARPHDFMAGEFSLLGFTSTAASFPSGHTMAAFAAAGVFFSGLSRGRVAIIVVVLLVPLARMATGRHFLSDVLAGAVVGLLLAGLARRIVARLTSHST